jgi:hypothetical protein
MPLAPLALGAAAIHAWAAAEHASESVGISAAFVVLAVGQAALGLLTFSRVRAGTVLAGVAGSTVVACVWLATRTVHVPLLPATPESIGGPDVAATLLEVIFAVGGGAVLVGIRLDRLSGAAWALSGALVTTPLGHVHDEGAAAIHSLLHVGAIAAAFAAFCVAVWARVRAGNVRFSLALGGGRTNTR